MSKNKEFALLYKHYGPKRENRNVPFLESPGLGILPQTTGLGAFTAFRRC